MTDTTALVRLWDWCQAMMTPQVIEGQRTIARHPEAPDAERWHGRIAHPNCQQMTWKGADVEGVVKQMNQACGEQPDACYQVTE